MGDVEIEIPGVGQRHLHFPSFYGFDPETRTVAVQEYDRPEQRIPVDGLIFGDERGAGLPSVFYRPSPGMEPFLTPWLQKNWAAIRPH
jgi:hypothetical protein